MNFFVDFLSDRALLAPDGRPLHAYRCADKEFLRLTSLLTLRVGIGELLLGTASSFVLWTAEHIRRNYRGGSLTWDFVFSGLGQKYDRHVAVGLTEKGLKYWRRPLRRRESDNSREFLYSLLVEGGLPDALLEQESSYRKALLGSIAEIEGEGPLGEAAAEVIARRHVRHLPQTFCNTESEQLLADLALKFVSLRKMLPKDLPAAGAEVWLEQHAPGWQDNLPLQMSERSRQAIIRPAFAVSRARVRTETAVVVKRIIRQRVDGTGWAGGAVLHDGAFLSADFLPGQGHEKQQLRLISEGGDSFRATPEPGGWRLVRFGGRGDLLLPLALEKSCIVTAYSDGRSLGEVALDTGLAPSEEQPSFWREEGGQTEPVELSQISALRCRGKRVWLLTASEVRPFVLEGSLEVGSPEKIEGGLLWPIAGSGRIDIGGKGFQVYTSAEQDAEILNLRPVGARLLSWRTPVGLFPFLGRPKFLGGVGDGPLLDISGQVGLRPVPRLLAGFSAAWEAGEHGDARLRIVALPRSLSLTLNTGEGGRATLVVRGGEAGWHVRFEAADQAAQAILGSDGSAALALVCPSATPLEARLVLSDPSKGERLELVRPWEATEPVLVSELGEVLRANRSISLASLAGWRGLLPELGGAVQLRITGAQTPVAFGAGGSLRLPAFAPLLAQALALRGPDDRVNFRLVAGGAQTPRLEVGYHDWTARQTSNGLELGARTVELRAISLQPPLLEKECVASGTIDPKDWLGVEPGVWLVQGRCTVRGGMRPVAWSAEPMPRTSREQRISAYAGFWNTMIADPEHGAWEWATELVVKARESGGCSGLDQIQALGRVPAAAACLVLRAQSDAVSQMLELETEAPFWWPLVRVEDWLRAVRHADSQIKTALAVLALPAEELDILAWQELSRRIFGLLHYRPELTAHLGAALEMAGLSISSNGEGTPLNYPVKNPRMLLEQVFVRELASRAPEVPQGTGHLQPDALRLDTQVSPHLNPLLWAPLLAGEIAAGRGNRLTAPETLELIALRYADPIWFDVALPCAVQMALQLEKKGLH